MTTPRKHWFKVADSILREEWSDGTLATHVRLMAWLNQRWARDGIEHSEAGSAVIGALDAMAITGTKRPHIALQRLASHPSVARLTSASASLVSHCQATGELLADTQHPTGVLLKWDKFSIFQEYGSRSPGSDFPVPSPPISDSVSNSYSEPKTPKNKPLVSAAPRGNENQDSRGELEHLAERDSARLANCLAKLKGSPEEKLAWLRSGIGQEILAAADEQLPDDATPKQRSAFLVRVTTARYRTYLKTDRGFRNAKQVAVHRAAVAARSPPVSDGPMEVGEFDSVSQSMFGDEV